MDIEIISVEIKKGIVMITGIDVSDENLRRMERMKDDGMQTEVTFCFDSINRKIYNIFITGLNAKRQLKEQLHGRSTSQNDRNNYRYCKKI